MALPVFDTNTIKIMPEKGRFLRVEQISNNVIPILVSSLNQENEKSFYSIGNPNTDLEYVRSTEYRKKFENITQNPKVNKAIYERCKAGIIHQSGSYYEDLSIISIEDGALIGSTSGKIANEVFYGEKLLKEISKYSPYTLIAIHNHATNLPPSNSDLISARDKKYAFGIVACHNGKVFKYAVKGDKKFTKMFFEKLIVKFELQHYNKYEAIIKTLKYLKTEYAVEWEEL